MNLAFAHEPGTAISCLSIPIILHKEGPPGVPETELKCGFKIGGGIDQDYRKVLRYNRNKKMKSKFTMNNVRVMLTTESTLQRSLRTAPRASPGSWSMTRSFNSMAMTSRW